MTRWIRKHALTPSTDTLVRATVAVTALLVLLAGLTLYLTVQGRLGDERSKRSGELRSCSSSFSAELVTGPTAVALVALADHGTDSPEFRAAKERLHPERFIRLSQLSRTDPDEFLAICRRATP